MVRRNNNNSRIAFTTRGFGLLAANGDGDSGQEIWCARSGVPLGAPAISAADVNISNNICAGMWQHCAWCGTDVETTVMPTDTISARNKSEPRHGIWHTLAT